MSAVPKEVPHFGKCSQRMLRSFLGAGRVVPVSLHWETTRQGREARGGVRGRPHSLLQAMPFSSSPSFYSV